MPISDQGAGDKRYAVIPRTVIFLRRGDSYLLLLGSPTKRLWAGKYNGIGGHVERGEDVLSSARRELLEETGLTADLWLCGVLAADGGPRGVCVFIFTGEALAGEPRPSREGVPEWIEYHRIHSLPAVEDLPVLLGRIHAMKRGDPPFFARSYYDPQQRLRVVFAG